ncbi:hypothetical protein ILYODFUR_024066 [Ilyodon furcidens]|uniref:PB1 domain-containing protein n=1 Tax=Ilyodon furcidens TaxID=33524 RepID=A0ABV0U9U6_9TELE
MLLRVLYGGEQKYVRLSDLTYDVFLREVCLKFNIPEGRQQDPKVYDQSDTEVDFDIFEEKAKQSPGTFRVTLSSEEAVAALSLLRSRQWFRISCMAFKDHSKKNCRRERCLS